jgi:hypothetical protein
MLFILIGLLLSLVMCILYAALVVASEAAKDEARLWAYDENMCDDSICSGDCDSCEIRNREQQ